MSNCCQVCRVYPCECLSSIVERVVVLLEPLTPEQRVELFGEVDRRYCRHCGDPQPVPPASRCQCWNDE